MQLRFKRLCMVPRSLQAFVKAFCFVKFNFHMMSNIKRVDNKHNIFMSFGILMADSYWSVLRGYHCRKQLRPFPGRRRRAAETAHHKFRNENRRSQNSPRLETLLGTLYHHEQETPLYSQTKERRARPPRTLFAPPFQPFPLVFLFVIVFFFVFPPKSCLSAPAKR